MCVETAQLVSILPGLVAGSDACLTGIQEVAGSILWSSNILSWTGHEIISTAILLLLLIQVGQLSVTGERMGT